MEGREGEEEREQRCRLSCTRRSVNLGRRELAQIVHAVGTIVAYLFVRCAFCGAAQFHQEGIVNGRQESYRRQDLAILHYGLRTSATSDGGAEGYYGAAGGDS